MTYHLITCIVERGKADKVIDAAIAAGAQAATLYYGRGRGIREKLGFVGKFIQPEKEIILIVTEGEKTNAVFGAITDAGELKQAGKGFAYTQTVDQAVGFL